MSDLMGKRIVFIWLLLAFAWVAKSQNYMIKGIVTDSITGEPLPYVAVILKGTTIGATTDLDGEINSLHFVKPPTSQSPSSQSDTSLKALTVTLR